MPSLLRSRLLRSQLLESEPSFVGARAQNLERERYLASITVGKPGQCGQHPTLLITRFDDSGSVTGGNDPIGRRYLEAELAIRRVGSRCRCGKDMVAVAHFDPPTSGDLRPTPITRRHQKDISQSLAMPADGNGSSCLGPSLADAYQLVAQFPEHHPVLIVLSDFELFDRDVDLVLRQLITFPGDVHAVVLNSPPPQVLLDADHVTVTPVDHRSTPGTVARAVFTALAANRRDAEPLPAVASSTG